MARRPLNLKHLRYFAEVARRGSVTAAARTLFVAPQTVSAQIQLLEKAVGQPLLERVGRGLMPTTAGETALDYANAIFALGDELAGVLTGSAQPRAQSLRIAVTDSVPKLLTVSLLEPLLADRRDNLELSCREGDYAALLGLTVSGELDGLLADAAVPANFSRILQAHALADSGISFLASRPLARRLARAFPASLDGAPYIAGSAPGSYLGQAIDAWFARLKVSPRLAGRIDDSALLKAFAQRGLGVIAVPSSVETAVIGQYRLALVGRTEEIRQAVFLIRRRGQRVHPLIRELEATHQRVIGSLQKP